MGAVVRGGDHVHERAGDGVVAVVPLDRHVDVELALHLGRGHVAAVVEHRDGLGERAVAGQPEHLGDLLAGRQVLAELADAAVEAELGRAQLARRRRRPRRPVAAVGVSRRADGDGQAGHQVGGLPGALGEAVVAEGGVLEEHLPVRPEPDPGAGLGLATRPAWRSPDFLVKAASGPGAANSPATPRRKLVVQILPVPVDLDVEPGGERVHDRRADAVQAAGGGVGAAAELAARVQPGHAPARRRRAWSSLVVDGDAAAVVAHLGRPVGVQDDLDPGAVAAERLVHRVVEDLPEAVLQPPAVGRADVHAGALADRVQALKDRQVLGAVGVGGILPSPGRFV